MTDNTPELPIDENQLIAERRGKLKALREQGIAYPNDFTRADYAQDLQVSIRGFGARSTFGVRGSLLACTRISMEVFRRSGSALPSPILAISG